MCAVIPSVLRLDICFIFLSFVALNFIWSVHPVDVDSMAKHSNSLSSQTSILSSNRSSQFSISSQSEITSSLKINSSYAWPSNVSETINHLVKHYDNRLRPKFGTSVLEIGMELIIASFDRISEVNMDYTITMYLNQYWHDDRLAFSMLHPKKQMTLTGEFAGRIWVPDTFFANDKHSFLHDVTEQNKMIRLSGDGSIMYGMRFTTTLACMMDLHYYPLDEQNCTVEIESYGYPLEDVKMSWKDGKASIHNVEKIDMPQFTLANYEVISHVIALSTGKYQRLSLSFKLRRNVGFFVFQTYLPSILIVMLSWVSFWINHEATSARVALGITTVLTMTTISTGVRSSLPRISYVKAIDIYLVMCFVFVFAALLEYAAVNYTYWGARSKRKAKRLNERLQREQQNNQKVNDENNRSNHDHEDVRMSPILGIKNNSSTPCDEVNDDGYPATVIRMTPILPRPYAVRTVSSALRRRRCPPNFAPLPNSNAGNYVRRRRVLSTVRRRAKQIKDRLPKVRDVNKIDEMSRIAFPSLFILFNLSYWCFYLI